MRNGGGGAQIGKRRLLNCGWWVGGIVRQWGDCQVLCVNFSYYIKRT